MLVDCQVPISRQTNHNCKWKNIVPKTSEHTSISGVSFAYNITHLLHFAYLIPTMFLMVREVGLEPTHTKALDPKSSVSAIPPHPVI